jgi:peptidoglycan/LPS O-acetylase OafA/YrhL
MDISKKDKIPALDHLRALAITLVFFFHYRLFAHPGWVDAWMSFGWVGVDLFFVLSGYLIANQIFAGIKMGQFSLGTFFLKRFFRILPAYWTVLALYFLLPGFGESERLAPLWKYLTFTQNFGLDLRHHRAFSHAWSLCIEEQFYLLLPFTVLFLQYIKVGRGIAWLVAALFVLGFISRVLSWNSLLRYWAETDVFGLYWYKYIYYPTYNRLDGLLAGITIAGIFQFFPNIAAFIRKQANKFLILGVLLITCAYFFCENMQTIHATVLGYPLVAIAFGCMVVSGVCPESALNKYSFNLTSRLATLSYAIYLVHKGTNHIVQVQFIKLGVKGDSSLMLLLCVAGSVIGALVLHYVVERPFLTLKERILFKKSK